MAQCHLQSRRHYDQVLEALQSRRDFELSIVGNESLSTQSSSLWLYSPFIRSIVDSLKNVQENVVLLPDFSCQEVKAGLEVIESSYKEIITFNSTTRNLLETLGIHWMRDEDEEYLDGDLQDDSTNDDISKDILEGDTTIEELIPINDIKVEKDVEEEEDAREINEIQNILLREMKDSYDEGGEDENRMTDHTEIRNILESSQREKVETEDIMDVSTAKTEVETETLREYSRGPENELSSDEELSDIDDSHEWTGLWKCRTCHRTFQSKQNAHSHFEVHITGLCYPCQ